MRVTDDRQTLFYEIGRSLHCNWVVDMDGPLDKFSVRVCESFIANVNYSAGLEQCFFSERVINGLNQLPITVYFRSLSKSKSKYLLKAYNKRIRTVQCGYMQYRINTKT